MNPSKLGNQNGWRRTTTTQVKKKKRILCSLSSLPQKGIFFSNYYRDIFDLNFFFLLCTFKTIVLCFISWVHTLSYMRPKTYANRILDSNSQFLFGVIHFVWYWLSKLMLSFVFDYWMDDDALIELTLYYLKFITIVPLNWSCLSSVETRYFFFNCSSSLGLSMLSWVNFCLLFSLVSTFCY